MSLGRWIAWWTTAVILAIMLGAGCGSSDDGGGGGGDAGGPDATSTSCTTDSDCIGQIPPTMPANCAVATCSALQGICVFKAKDQDGDGHAAANCVSTTNVPIQAGDDCDDQDKDLYPGHSLPCSLEPDGGTPTEIICTAGAYTCQNGVKSACIGTKTCPHVCLNSACVDCTPGTTQCGSNNTTQTCGANGFWGNALTCPSGTPSCAMGVCVQCQGSSQHCNGQQPQTCSSSGMWQDQGAPCSVHQICDPVRGTCQAECSISGTLYTDGALNPNDSCQTCTAMVDTMSWSNKADGMPCGSGQTCSNGQCGTQCDIMGTIYPTGTLNPANACQSCQPGTRTADWTDLATGTACGSGQVCNAGACAAGCYISGAFRLSGQANPVDTCQTCRPATSTTAWTNTVADGVSCGAGAVCSTGSCISGCSIGGVVYTAATVDPNDSCETCLPGTSTTSWTTTSAEGATCGTGHVCKIGACISGCFIGGVVYSSGAVNPANSCQSCQPGVATTAWSNLPTGSSCGAGQVCSGSSCVGDCYIASTLYASGALNPANNCQSCQPGTTTTAWSNLANATSCGTAQWCYLGACSTTPPSCEGGGAGRSNCGTGSESCCTSLPVTGNTFYRTYTNSGGGATGTSNSATVSSLQLDKYEVTVGRFRQFVTAWNGGSGWTPAGGSGKHAHLNGGQGLVNSTVVGSYEPGWALADNANISPTAAHLACDASYATWTASGTGNEKLPINCVTWAEAYAFCIWDGGFLPSETEWEYTSAGGTLQREYPWGTTAPGSANVYAIYGCDYPSGSGTCSGLTSIASVGTPTAGAGFYGQLDMAGGVYEWAIDWNAAYASTCSDCADVNVASNRIMRGGAFNDTPSSLWPWTRVSQAPTTRNYVTGIRCARSP